MYEQQPVAYHIISNAPLGELEEELDRSVNVPRHGIPQQRRRTSYDSTARGGGRSSGSGSGTRGTSRGRGGRITTGIPEEPDNDYNSDDFETDAITNTPRNSPARAEESQVCRYIETNAKITTKRSAATDGDSSDDESCSLPIKRKYRLFNTSRSPWKIISKHSGTRRLHYHIIYISTNKAWGYNSRFGEAIRKHQHKVVQITCITCLLNYLSPGPNRTTLRDILSEDDKANFRCVAHSLGITHQTKQNTTNAANMDSEGRNSILCEQGAALHQTDARLVGGTSETDEAIPESGQRRMESQQVQLNDDIQPDT